MNRAVILIAAFPALLVVGALFAPLLARRDRRPRSAREPRPREGDLEHSRVRDVQGPLAVIESWSAIDGAGGDPPAEGDQYFTDWAALQAKFVG